MLGKTNGDAIKRSARLVDALPYKSMQQKLPGPAWARCSPV